MTIPNPTACSDERREQLVDLAAGRIGEDASEDLLRHVEECPRCSSGLAIVADVASAAIAAATSAPPRVRLRRVPWLASLSAAAAVLVTAYVVTRDDALSRLADLRPPGLVSSVPRGGAGEALPAEAMRAFEGGRYAEAAKGLDRFLAARSEDHPVGAHYAGVAHLLAGDVAVAIERLRGAVASSEGLLREASLWYLAQAFLMRGDARGAREALETLRAGGGDYAPNAEALLGKLAGAGR